MFFLRKKEFDVTKGAVFERKRAHDLLEKATVTWVGEDSFGIPHVRFNICMSGMDDRVETRLLARAVFVFQYVPATTKLEALQSQSSMAVR